MLSTKNIIISFFAVLTIAMIVGNVLGFFLYAMGWALGFLEAIVGVIVIGFSVDYVIHLGIDCHLLVLII